GDRQSEGPRSPVERSPMTKEELAAVLAEAEARAKSDGSGNDVPDLVLRILTVASGTDTVRAALKDVKAGRALLRFTDIDRAIEFQAGEGRLHAEAADMKGPGPKVDATSETWLGLLGGTLKPWLAFTRGMVVCRAGHTEHGERHANTSADGARFILKSLGHEARRCELGAIAAYLHDIGNVITREKHGQTGALLSKDILDALGFPTEEVAIVMGAIAN